MEAKANTMLKEIEIFKTQFKEKHKVNWKIEKPKKWTNDNTQKATIRITFRMTGKKRDLVQIQFQFEEEFDQFLEASNWFRGATNCHYNTGGRLTIRVTIKFNNGSEEKRMLQKRLII